MARERHESTWQPVKYRKFINQFKLDIIISIRRCERIEIKKKICRQRMSIILNQICLNEEMLPKSYLPNPSARAGYDTRSIFKQSLTGLNSEFSFS